MVMKLAKRELIILIIFCYSLGFLTHWMLFKYKENKFSFETQEDKMPVHPKDLRPEDLMDALHRDMLDRMGKSSDRDFNFHHNFSNQDQIDENHSYGLKQFLVEDINRSEDEKFVYYEIPLLNEEGERVELNVSVKEGMILISKKSTGENHQMESTRSLSIEPGLIASEAKVIQEKEKIVIKVPKA